MLTRNNEWRANSEGRKTKSQILGIMESTATKSRFIARNTVEHWQPDGSRCIRFHATDVLRFLPNGRIRMTSGGWKTVTTRDRLNSNLPRAWNIRTAKGVWTITTPAGSFDFVDGCEFFAKSGKPCKPSIHGKNDKSNKRDSALIRGYLDAMSTATPDSLMGAGDPWILPDETTGKYRESMVRDWLRDRYVFEAMVRHAFRFSGSTDFAASWAIVKFCRSGKWDSYDLAKVRRYLRACLGYAV